jgi:hypothetical protein
MFSGQRRHASARRDLADGVAANLDDDEVAGGVERKSGGTVEFRRRALAVGSRVVGSRGAGECRHDSGRGHLSDQPDVPVRHIQVACCVGHEPRRIVEAGGAAAAILAPALARPAGEGCHPAVPVEASEGVVSGIRDHDFSPCRHGEAGGRIEAGGTGRSVGRTGLVPIAGHRGHAPLGRKTSDRIAIGEEKGSARLECQGADETEAGSGARAIDEPCDSGLAGQRGEGRVSRGGERQDGCAGLHRLIAPPDDGSVEPHVGGAWVHQSQRGAGGSRDIHSIPTPLHRRITGSFDRKCRGGARGHIDLARLGHIVGHSLANGMVAGVGDVESALGVDRDAARRAEAGLRAVAIPGPRQAGAPAHGGHGSARRHPANGLVAPVHDEHVARGRIHRDSLGTLKPGGAADAVTAARDVAHTGDHGGGAVGSRFQDDITLSEVRGVANPRGVEGQSEIGIPLRPRSAELRYRCHGTVRTDAPQGSARLADEEIPVVVQGEAVRGHETRLAGRAVDPDAAARAAGQRPGQSQARDSPKGAITLIGYDDVTLGIDHDAGRAAEGNRSAGMVCAAAESRQTRKRRDCAGRRDPADGVVAGVSDVEVQGGIDREAGGAIEPGVAARAIRRARATCQSGEGGDRALGSDSTDGVIAGVGHVDGAEGIDRHAGGTRKTGGAPIAVGAAATVHSG